MLRYDSSINGYNSNLNGSFFNEFSFYGNCCGHRRHGSCPHVAMVRVPTSPWFVSPRTIVAMVRVPTNHLLCGKYIFHLFKIRNS